MRSIVNCKGRTFFNLSYKKFAKRLSPGLSLIGSCPMINWTLSLKATKDWRSDSGGWSWNSSTEDTTLPRAESKSNSRMTRFNKGRPRRLIPFDIISSKCAWILIPKCPFKQESRVNHEHKTLSNRGKLSLSWRRCWISAGVLALKATINHWYKCPSPELSKAINVGRNAFFQVLRAPADSGSAGIRMDDTSFHLRQASSKVVTGASCSLPESWSTLGWTGGRWTLAGETGWEVAWKPGTSSSSVSCSGTCSLISQVSSANTLCQIVARSFSKVVILSNIWDSKEVIRWINWSILLFKSVPLGLIWSRMSIPPATSERKW